MNPVFWWASPWFCSPVPSSFVISSTPTFQVGCCVMLYILDSSFQPHFYLRQFRGKPVVWVCILFPQVQTSGGAFINEKINRSPAGKRPPSASANDVWGAQAVVMPGVWAHLFSLFTSWVLSPCGLHHSQRPANSSPPLATWSIAVLFKHTPSLWVPDVKFQGSRGQAG